MTASVTWKSGDPDPPPGVTHIADRDGQRWERMALRPGIWRRASPSDGRLSGPESWPELLHYYGPVTDWDNPPGLHVCPNCAPGYDCERGTYTSGGEF